MDISRREWLRGSLGLAITTKGPELLLAKEKKGYTQHEIEERLQSGKGLAGITKHDLTTPALLLDRDSFEANVVKMSEHSRKAGIDLRPHAKTHKCAEIALRQIRAGALGVCVATIREAEAMAAAGVRGLMITSEMVGRSKIERLLNLTRKQPDTMSVVDNLTHVEQLFDAAVATKTKLNVLLDVDPGGRRTGIPGGEKVVELAEKIVKLSHLNLRGIHAYSGAASHTIGFEARREYSKQAMGPALETFARLKQLGMPVEILSGGSTGTYNIDPALAGMTELQVGSYVFMDADYRKIGGQNGPTYDDFAPSLTVLATVISKNYSDTATVDAGYKAFATDRKFGPEIKDASGIGFSFGGDEHGVLSLENPSRDIKVGDRLEFIVPHCDPNVNLYDRIYCTRGENVDAMWRIVGRHAA